MGDAGWCAGTLSGLPDIRRFLAAAEGELRKVRSARGSQGDGTVRCACGATRGGALGCGRCRHGCEQSVLWREPDEKCGVLSEVHLRADA